MNPVLLEPLVQLNSKKTVPNLGQTLKHQLRKAKSVLHTPSSRQILALGSR